MKHIELETEGEQVRQFVLSLELGSAGLLLDLHGKPVARVLPVAGGDAEYDRNKLEAAILARRDESRRLNEDWRHADEEAWSNLPSSES